MGFTNGIRDNNTTVREKGEKGDKGEGFKLTEDGHFHLVNKRLTNVDAPVEDNDAVTKKYLTNALKVKAASNYVVNELAKKANLTSLNNYVLKSSLPSSDALKDYYTKSAVDSALSVKVDQADLNDYYTKSEIDSKNGFLFFETLRHNNARIVLWNISDCDTSNNHGTFDISLSGNFSQLRVLKSGYYEINFNDSFKNAGRIEIHIEGDLIAKNTFMLNNVSNWTPFNYHTVLKLKASDLLTVKCTGTIIWDGGNYSCFSIKKIA